MTETQANGSEKHSVIHVECDECAAVDTVTLLEHPRDSKQHRLVAEAHHTLADDHADETDHSVEVGQTQGSPEVMVEFARSLAEGLDGVDEELLDAEMIS